MEKTKAKIITEQQTLKQWRTGMQNGSCRGGQQWEGEGKQRRKGR
jgi:hypothetical protein